jgi:hypothetical protein
MINLCTSAQGADVLWITSPNLPSLPVLDAETSLGKRTAQLDFNIPTDHQQLTKLVAECDVFMQAYRPGGLEAKGFGVKDLVKTKPGIICANLTAWGWEGPWKDRHGVRITIRYQCHTLCNCSCKSKFSSIHWFRRLQVLIIQKERLFKTFKGCKDLLHPNRFQCNVLTMLLATCSPME